MIHRLTHMDLEQLYDAYGDWFPKNYEEVWEDPVRPVRHYVRRPWGSLFRPLYRLRDAYRRKTSLGHVLYPLVKHHPEHLWPDFLYTHSARRRIVLAWRAWRCDWTSHRLNGRRRYGYPPIWKAD